MATITIRIFCLLNFSIINAAFKTQFCLTSEAKSVKFPFVMERRVHEDLNIGPEPVTWKCKKRAIEKMSDFYQAALDNLGWKPNTQETENSILKFAATRCTLALVDETIPDDMIKIIKTPDKKMRNEILIEIMNEQWSIVHTIDRLFDPSGWNLKRFLSDLEAAELQKDIAHQTRAYAAAINFLVEKDRPFKLGYAPYKPEINNLSFRVKREIFLCSTTPLPDL